MVGTPRDTFVFLVCPLGRQQVAAGGANAGGVTDGITRAVPPVAPVPATFYTPLPTPLLVTDNGAPEVGTERIVEVKHEHVHATVDITSAAPLPSFSVESLTGSAVGVTFLTSGPVIIDGPAVG